MKIIVPMAGEGKRMRPHTFTTPKPLIPIAGRSIVERLVSQIASMTDEPIEEVAYVIGRFGEETEQNLANIAKRVGAKASIYYQDEALGTAHAIHCAAPSLDGKVVIAFADTLFDAAFTIDSEQDGIIWVKEVDDPSQFGVVETNDEGVIDRFVEKPQEPVSDEAIIGIYYFRDGQFLKEALQYLIDHSITGNGEYQLTDAMENMKKQGAYLKTGKVNHWMDCGNKDATVATNSKILELNHKKEQLVAQSVMQDNALIIEPCYIGENVVIRRSVVGPYVTIGDGTEIEGSVIDNSLILNHSTVKNANVANAMIGNNVRFEGKAGDLNLGDYTTIQDRIK